MFLTQGIIGSRVRFKTILKSFYKSQRNLFDARVHMSSGSNFISKHN